MPSETLRRALERPVLRQALVPVSAFVTIVAVGVVGFVELAGVGFVEATFWLVDPTGIELHFAAHEGPERATKLFAIAVTVGLVLAGVWTGETVPR